MIEQTIIKQKSLEDLYRTFLRFLELNDITIYDDEFDIQIDECYYIITICNIDLLTLPDYKNPETMLRYEFNGETLRQCISRAFIFFQTKFMEMENEST